MSEIENAAQILFSARKGVAFTGAGVSAASGISTYQDPGGLWDRYGSQGMLNVLAKHPEKAHEILGGFFSALEAADELDLPVRERTHVYNSRRATELGKWAEAKNRGDAFHEAIFRAYFAEGLDISDVAVLREICAGLGLDPDEAERVLSERAYTRAVDDDWDYCGRPLLNTRHPSP